MEKVRKFFEENDRFAIQSGVEIEEVAPGFARCGMTVQDRHLNGADVVHGGALFTLADLAFGVASNTRGQLALGINASITYVKAARSGRLTAEAREVSANHKLAAYEVRVCDESGDTLVLFQGTVYRKSAPFPG